jgi:hypothetical protein
MKDLEEAVEHTKMKHKAKSVEPAKTRLDSGLKPFVVDNT